METLFELVFADNQIVTDDFFAKETNQHIDSANRMMYDFYTVNKHKLNTFFLVIRKENNSGIRLDRLSEEQVSHRLNDKDFADTVLNVKVWAFYDKNKGDLDVSHIFNATDVNLHCIQNLCQKMREITIKKPAPTISRMGSMASNSSKKSTASGTTPATNLTANNKPANNTEITNKSKITTQKSMDEAMFSAKNKLATQKSSDEMITEKDKSNLKKRKTMGGDEMAQEVGKDKELKKTKLTREPSGSDLTAKPLKTIQEEVKEPAKPTKVIQEVKEHAKPQQNNTKSGAIEIEDDEETYYGGQPAAKKTTLGGLSRLESKTSQYSFEEEEEIDPKPAVKNVQQPKNSSPSFERKAQSTQMNVETMPGDSEDTIKVKKTRKVEQDKTYMDEKGYLVVEKVLVDEEYWETVKKNGAPSQPLTNSQVKKQAQKPVEKSQSTLGSFFKKK